jgi:hypothetical protein
VRFETQANQLGSALAANQNGGAAPIMCRPECLKVFGPRLFGLDEDFRYFELRSGEGLSGTWHL